MAVEVAGGSSGGRWWSAEADGYRSDPPCSPTYYPDNHTHYTCTCGVYGEKVDEGIPAHNYNYTEWWQASFKTWDSQTLEQIIKANIYQKTENAYFGNSAADNSLNIPLSITYSGIVWEDAHTGKGQDMDGTYKAGEKGIKNIKVTVYDTKYNNGPYSTYTDANGNYILANLPMGKYYAVFDYDGQTYISTTYFVDGESHFSINSKAQENKADRIAFNNKFYEIVENGVVNRVGGYNTYTKIGYNTNTAGKSYAITNNDGKVEGEYTFFKMSATTMQENSNGSYNIITYPREDEVHLSSINKVALGKTYTATYPKLGQINFSLSKRTEADFEIKKDIYKVIVEVNGKKQEYTYNTRAAIKNYDIEQKVKAEYANTVYNRALYRTDYSYKIDDYIAATALNKRIVR